MPIPRIRQISLQVLAAGALALSTSVAYAESPFITQVPKGVTVDLPPNAGPVFAPTPGVPAFTPPPQLVVPHLPKTNAALTVEIGNNNRVLQVQNGSGDQSTVGIIGGDNNNVLVDQNGNNLQSNLFMIGTKGFNVGILQPNGSAPVNMAIIHVPAGTVIIPRL